MKQKIKNLFRCKACIGVIAVSFLVWLVLVTVLSMNFTKRKDEVIINEISESQAKIDAVLKTYESFSSFIYEELINDNIPLSIMYDATFGDEDERNSKRDQLYLLFEDKYEILKQYNFRQLHFHLPNGDSFLRMHAPLKFGDNLFDIRDSIRIANTYHKKMIGFEEGRIFNGYRFVYPLFYNDKHVGSVEVSISIEAIIEILADLYVNTDFDFIISKEVVDEIVFDDSSSNYVESFVSKNYLFDKEVDNLSKRINNLLTEEQRMSMFEENEKEVDSNLSKGEDFILSKSIGDKEFLIIFNTIENISREQVAYVMQLKEDDSIYMLKVNLTINIIVVSVITLTIMIVLLMLALERNKIKNLSETDSLTKIFNRMKFNKLATAEFHRWQRYKEDFSIILFDIDHFKKVNDKFGHRIGDNVLIEIANVVKKGIRTTDVFARWGGEEFVVLLTNTKKEEALIVAEKIRLEIDNHVFDTVNHVTVSLGVSKIEDSYKSVFELIDNSDRLMYEAKNSGRNKVCC